MLIPYRNMHPRIKPTAFVEESARIIGDVEIGDQASVWFNVVIRGDVHFIRIGDRTNIQDGTVIHVSNQTFPAVLGREVTIGHNVTLHGCTIGDRCLIGMGSVLLDGVTVGEESMVAAGSVISPGTTIPPRSLVMGVPGRVKRSLSKGEVSFLEKSAANYIGYMQDYR